MTADDELLADILRYDPSNDPTDLLSRAFGEVQALREAVVVLWEEMGIPEVKVLRQDHPDLVEWCTHLHDQATHGTIEPPDHPIQSRSDRPGLWNAPGPWHWEQRGDSWWRVNSLLNIVDGPHAAPIEEEHG